ncbi:type 4 pilus major pilin (plasmid) [Pseudoduganella sp. UC29_106]|uniref:type 4 pilus major pilin n=1 Tax=Pseudoduganella sp. UC29_106 TaxID=3374553 RepID=UPI003757B956
MKTVNQIKSHYYGKNKKYQAGAVMITDIIIWGGVVLGAMAFIFFLNRVALPFIKGWQEASAISSHMKAAAAIYSGAPSFTGLNNATVTNPNSNIIDPKYLPGGNVINNQFGGTATFGVTQTNVTGDTMTYTDTLIPTSSCPHVANQLASDADRITVAGTMVKAAGGVIDANSLNDQCKSAAFVTLLVEKFKNS